MSLLDALANALGLGDEDDEDEEKSESFIETIVEEIRELKTLDPTTDADWPQQTALKRALLDWPTRYPDRRARVRVPRPAFEGHRYKLGEQS